MASRKHCGLGLDPRKRKTMKPMKIIHLVAVTISLSALIIHAEESTPPPGFDVLFNGEDLSGWQASESIPSGPEGAVIADFPTHWVVENGELVSDGKGAYAASQKEFGNFELQIEYMLVREADGGIFLRGVPEVQLGDGDRPVDPNRPTYRPQYGSGGLIHNPPKTLGHEPSMVNDSPFGRWNKLKIRQIGARTWVTLNNQQVVQGASMENSLDPSKPMPEKGPIVLQADGGEIRWRNIYVREISAVEGDRFLATHWSIPDPTAYDVSYGPHYKQVMHFWKAESETPTPVVLYIHGGAWMNMHRMFGLPRLLKRMLDSGISVVSVEYRFIHEATQAGLVPPVKGPLHDAARALQLVRSKAAEWNIDKERIGASGGSAGACSSLWLAFTPDMADPDSDDPVARESTRLWCAAVGGAQTTLDPQQMVEWTPNSSYGGHAFGFRNFADFLAERESILPWIAEFSPYALVTSDDPPVYLHYGSPPALGEEQKDPTHTANFGVKLKERCDAVGVECELFHPGALDVQHKSIADYLLSNLPR